MEETVTERYLFYIKPSEASIIVARWLTDDGCAFAEQIVGGRADVGETLWVTLKKSGFAEPVGSYGKLTPAVLNGEFFARTRFVEAKESRKAFKKSYKRPQELPERERARVPVGKSLEDLKAIAAKLPFRTEPSAPKKPKEEPLQSAKAPAAAEQDERLADPAPEQDAAAQKSWKDELIERIGELIEEEVMLAQELAEINHRRHTKTGRLGEVRGERRALQDTLLRLVQD